MKISLSFCLALLLLAGCGQGAKTPTGPAGEQRPAIAFRSNRMGNWDIFAMAADGTQSVNLTDHPAFDFSPAWSADGEKLAFVSTRRGNADIYVMDAEDLNADSLTPVHRDGMDIHVVLPDGEPVAGDLTSHPAVDDQPSWSPDGTRIAFTSDRDGNREIYVMAADGSDPRNLTQHPAEDFDPSWSPDGTRIAFVSDRDGNREIYVMTADGSDPVNLTRDPHSDLEPCWRPR